MEIQTVFSAVTRQHVENLLSACAYAVGSRDMDMLDELLRGVSIRLHGKPGSAAESPGQSILKWFDYPRTAQVQTVNNIAVHVSGKDAFYHATFQNWDRTRHPACTAVGTYEGRLAAGPQVWRWTEHSILGAGVLPG